MNERTSTNVGLADASNHSANASGATDVLRRTLDQLETASDTGEGTLGDVLNTLDARAFGFLFLLLALPCCLPFVYLLPQIVALPMLALAAQLAGGSTHPWMPTKLAARSFKVSAFRKVLDRAERYLGWIERLARPRFSFLTEGLGLRLVGLLLLAPTASILVPLPSTNTIPGIGVAVASVGLIERDGVLVVAGLLIGFLWIALLLTLGLEATTILREMAGSGA
ncbi:MAG: exopolysaccharide biosynthesis protein [Pseudomonadota bacterium]